MVAKLGSVVSEKHCKLSRGLSQGSQCHGALSRVISAYLAFCLSAFLLSFLPTACLSLSFLAACLSCTGWLAPMACLALAFSHGGDRMAFQSQTRSTG